MKLLLLLLIPFVAFAERDEVDDTATVACAEGESCVGRQTSQRGKHVNLRDNSGAELGIPTNPLSVSQEPAGGDFSFGQVTTAALTEAAVRKTAYTEQTTGAQRSIASASANDTAAGTGARIVKIEYCTAAFVCDLETSVTLNGTAYVNTSVSDIAYIQRMEVTSVGSGGNNAGIITLKAATAGGGATIGTIAATDNQTLWAHHYVATGETFGLTGFAVNHNGTTVGSGGILTLKARNLSASTNPEIQITDFLRLFGQDSGASRRYVTALRVTGPARITAYITPESASSTIFRAAFDFFEQQ